MNLEKDDLDQKVLGMRGARRPEGPGQEEAGRHRRGKGWYRKMGCC